MARPKVPHCKDCIHHMEEPLTWRVTVKARYSHYCLYNGKPKLLSGQDYRSSPSWCHKRIEYSDLYKRGLVK